MPVVKVSLKLQTMTQAAFPTIAAFTFLICGHNAYASGGGSKDESVVSLPDGVYLIERVSYAPMKMFSSEQEAKAYAEAIKKNPELRFSGLTEDAFFQLYLEGSDFIIHQMELTNQNEYTPKKNFFVSLNKEKNWAFEESGNTVTIVTNSVRDRPEDGGPIRGLLKTGESFYEELGTLGLNVIGSPQITKQTEVDLISGTTMQGAAYTGEMRRDSEGRPTNIVCRVDDPSRPSGLGFEIWYEGTPKHVSRVLVSVRLSNGTWHPTLDYIVKEASALPTSLRMDSFWSRFANEKTLTVIYNPQSGKVFFVDQKARLKEILDPGNSFVAASRRRRWLIASLVVITTVAFASIVAMKSKKPKVP